MRGLFFGLTYGRGNESTTWPMITRSMKVSVAAASYAGTREVRILLLLKLKEIAESNRNRGELREHREHESDVQTSEGCCYTSRKRHFGSSTCASILKIVSPLSSFG